MRKNKKKNKKKLICFIVLFVIIILLIIGLFFGNSLFKKEPKEKKVVNVVDEITDYGYSLDDNETEYYKGLFEELKGVLNNEVVDEEEYACLVGQLFLADFFNLDNKINKNDIGGVQFVYDSFQGDFTKFAKDSVYHTVENNIYGDRKQELPVVTNVRVGDVEQLTYMYLDESDEDAYRIEYSLEYEVDMGYQMTAVLVLVHHNDKLEIIKMMEE